MVYFRLKRHRKRFTSIPTIRIACASRRAIGRERARKNEREKKDETHKNMGERKRDRGRETQTESNVTGR